MTLLARSSSSLSRTFSLWLVAILPTYALPAETTNVPYAKWSRIELTFVGPDANGLGSPNPFSAILDVTFQSSKGKTFRVPGFFDGDGKGGLEGNVWRVRFAADEIGTWTYRSTSNLARLNAIRGQFQVVDIPSNAKGFWKWGRLESVSTADRPVRYLKFRDGPFWLKAGCDDPENFLGSYRNFDSLPKRIAAVNYLADRGINSMYIMTHNLGGDDNDVWPWVGNTADEAKKNSVGDVRFDVAKLEQWRQLFEHMQSRGVVPYLVLEDDSAYNEYDHRRYYREMIARFGYLPGIVFNLGEEHNENYSLVESLQLAKQLRDVDPFNIPLAIHNVNKPRDEYIRAAELDLTSIQTGQPGTRRGVRDATEHNAIALQWIHRCQELGARSLVINFDEGRPELDRRAWWSAYLGGAVWEAHVVEPYDQPFAAWEKTWTELGGARGFMEMLPFFEMEPRNDLVVEGTGFCLARPEQVYAVYLPKGGEVTLELPSDQDFQASWWNPAEGFDGAFLLEHVVAGGRRTLVAPRDGDWAVRLLATKPVNAPSTRP